MQRVSRLLLLLAALFFFLGVGAVALAVDGWGDMARAFTLLFGAGWWVLLCGGVLILGVTVWLMIVRRGAAPHVVPVEDQLERQRARALDRLARVTAMTSPDATRVVNALLCLPADVGSGELLLIPAPDRAVVHFDQQQVATLSSATADEVEAQLEQMAGGAGSVVEFRSSRGMRNLLIVVEESRTTIRPVDEDETLARQLLPSKTRRRSTSVVFRLEQPLTRRQLETGEIPIPPLARDDATDPGSTLMTGRASLHADGARPTLRVAPPREARIRLVLGALTFATVVGFFIQAYGWGACAVVGVEQAPWRSVQLKISSTPDGAEVTIGEQRVGTTPLAIERQCRGRAIKVLVRAAGHPVWQWNGICPAEGDLTLRAVLQAQR